MAQKLERANSNLRAKAAVSAGRALALLQEEVTACVSCPRLVRYRRQVAKLKRRAFQDWEYWGRPVPSFGDPEAELLIIGLAPGAHGSNRTGRMFTGDRSGDTLYKVLHRTGFATQAQSRSREDGLELRNAYITAAVRCAPPGNKPSPDEIRRCRRFLEREIDLLPNIKVVVALGRIAFDVYLSLLQDQGGIARRSAFTFAHNRLHRLGPDQPVLISSYHPSQQNTSTGRLTEGMLVDVFERVRRTLAP